MSTPNESPSHHFPSQDDASSTAPPKNKEKKRVGFSEEAGTPVREISQPRLGGSSGTSASARSDGPRRDRSPHDGVDHNELTRALSLIIQESDEDDEGGAQRPSSLPSPPFHASLSPLIPSGHRQPSLVQPEPSYFPPLRQQQQEQSEKAAKERADRLAQSVVRDFSNPQSRSHSLDGDSEDRDAADVEAEGTRYRRNRRKKPSDGNDDDDDHHRYSVDDRESPVLEHPHATAAQLVQAHARSTLGKTSALANQLEHDRGFHYDASLATSANRSGYSTPTVVYDQDVHEYVPPPAKYHGGILSSLLRLYNNSMSGTNSAVNSQQSTPIGTPASSRPPSPGPSDGAETPKRHSGLFFSKKSAKQSDDAAVAGKTKGQPRNGWYPGHRQSSSTTSLFAGLIGTSSMLASAGSADIGQAVTERVRRERPQLKRNRHSASSIFGVGGSPKSREQGGSSGRRKRREDEQIRITVHIAHVLSRHRYLTILCRALMLYGAPTHRLEDYLKMSARVLEIEAQFLYIPGCMLVSFDDSSTHTAEVKLVRAPQGVDLGKLGEVHMIYKEVVHDYIGVDEATTRLNAVMKRNVKFNRWLRVPVYGLASMCVAPFAFGGRFIDLPIAFVLGCIVGLLGLVAAPSSAMYSNVFEISAAVITSMLARAFGSIGGGNVFCFSALAQSSIALILPGYMVLCASLELQSQNIVAGSVRMVYAMIYTLFLGYGITIGTAVYGAMDSNATSDTNCKDPLARKWYFLFVPLFTVCLCIINQAKWRQMPMMVVISIAGFCVNTYASSYFSSNAQIPSTLGALCVGVLANLHSRTSRYFEIYINKIYQKHLRCRLERLRRRRWQWHGLMSASSSRRSSATVGNDGSDEYLDMPPYSKDATLRAEEGHGSTREEAAAAAAEAERKAPGSSEVIGYGLAAAAMLPAIFVQVPSGLAVNGSLLSGISAANELTRNATTEANGNGQVNNVAFTVLFSVIQVAIGITVGLFLSALIVYPLGKRRSALFSF